MSESNRQTLVEISTRAKNAFIHAELEKAIDAADRANSEFSKTAVDYSTAVAHLRAMETTALTELGSMTFIRIRKDRQGFFPCVDPSGRIGPVSGFQGVALHFPSALKDINEAGYCLAVEANTAAVYHLVCVAEHGLRALARDRRITFKKGPIELQQWGDIIRELENAVSAIGNWPKSKAREAAHEFYSKALSECRYFNDAYRRHVAHARRHYDRHEALSVMVHAREFMQLLASRISEQKRTPLIWKRVY